MFITNSPGTNFQKRLIKWISFNVYCTIGLQGYTTGPSEDVSGTFLALVYN